MESIPTVDAPDTPHAITVRGLYFDGQSSRPHQVTLQVHGNVALLTGEIERECGLNELRVSERFSRARRKVTFSDGAYLEIIDTAAFDALLHVTQYRESWLVRAQQNWWGTIAALSIGAIFVLLCYFFLFPWLTPILKESGPDAAECHRGSGNGSNNVNTAPGFSTKHRRHADPVPPMDPIDIRHSV